MTQHDYPLAYDIVRLFVVNQGTIVLNLIDENM